MDYNPAAKSLTAFAVGVSCHVFLFCRGEWDLATPKILASFAAVQTSLFVCLVSTSLDQDHYLLSTFKEVSGLGICLVLGTTLSMLVYRAAFHRLNRFPGPFIARLSNLYVTMLSAKDLHLYEEVEALHRKYGDFVRLGNPAPYFAITFANVLKGHLSCQSSIQLQSLLSTRRRHHAPRAHGTTFCIPEFHSIWFGARVSTPVDVESGTGVSVQRVRNVHDYLPMHYQL